MVLQETKTIELNSTALFQTFKQEESGKIQPHLKSFSSDSSLTPLHIDFQFLILVTDGSSGAGSVSMKTSHHDWRLLSSIKAPVLHQGSRTTSRQNLLVRKCISNNINSYNNGKIEPFWEVGNHGNVRWEAFSGRQSNIF